MAWIKHREIHGMGLTIDHEYIEVKVTEYCTLKLDFQTEEVYHNIRNKRPSKKQIINAFEKLLEEASEGALE